MRKILVLFFLTNFLNESFALTWPMPGAHWEYCRGGLGTDFRIFEYTRDTLINSVNYQVIERVNVSIYPDPGAVYTRYSNDTVYRYVQNQDYPLFIFNAQLGDVYTTFRTDLDVFSDSTCRSILPLNVFHADTVNYGSLVLKRWELIDTLFDDVYTGSAQASTWKVVERIGMMNDFPFTLNFWFSGNSCNLPSDMGDGYILHLYSDSSYTYTTTWNCSYAVGMEESQRQKEMQLYPNPVNTILNISVPSNMTSGDIVIYNVWGQEVFRSHFSESAFSISTEHLPNGIYMLKCKSAEIFLLQEFNVNH